MTIMHSPHWARSRTYINAVARAAATARPAEPAPWSIREVTRDILHVASARPSDTFASVIGRTCQTLGIKKHSLTAQHRAVSITNTRQILGWVGVKRCFRSYPQTALILNRDHTTILHAVRKIDRLISERGLAVPSDPLAAALYLNRELGGVQ